jgi:release factor glutamine methyltransferase
MCIHSESIAAKSMKPKSIKFAAMNIHEASQRLLFQLYDIYDDREAANIADWVMENITGWKKIDRIINRELKLSAPMAELLDKYISALKISTPVQYVLHESWFYGLKFYVDENVLIPRPETEELVSWVITDNENKSARILDIGTGSGCIPVALKKNLPDASLYGCDISNAALKVAKVNAELHSTTIDFFALDILKRNTWNMLPEVDIIVSNPPYIPLKEKQTMNKNVVQHEPHSALFVDDSDPLVFYRTIADIALIKLSANGYVFVEVHEDHAKDTADLFTLKGLKSIEIKKDMQGKERMVRAKRN